MRNLKKYLSVLLVVAIMATSMVPVFAAETYSYSAEAQKLNTLGLYAGVSTTTFDPDLGTALDRETGIVMLLRIFNLEATAKAMSDADAAAALAAYTDMGDVSEWALKSVAYAVKNGLVAGTTSTTLGAKVALSGEMYATLVLRQLGYTVGPNDYNNATYILADKGGLKITEAIKFDNKDLIKDDLVGITFAALNAKYATGETVLAALMEDGVVTVVNAVYAGVYTAPATPTPTATPTPVPFGIESVSSTNLAKIIVKFNQDINESTAETLTNYTLTGGSAVLTGGSATMQADKRTVVLQLATYATNQDEITLVVKNVKNATGSTIAETTKKISMLDTVVPTAISATLTAPNKIKITFSEPITTGATTFGNYKIDSYTYSLSGAPVLAAGLESVTVTLGTNLPAGEHTITVNPETTGTLADAAGFKVPKTTLTFVAGTDTVAPTVSVKSNTESSVTLKFSEAMKAGSVIGNANLIIRHTYNSNIYQVDGTSVAAGTGDYEYVVNFTTAKAFPVGNVNLYLSLSSSSGTVVEDEFGNDLVLPLTLSFENIVDTTKPTATVTFVDATHLDVAYSEAVTGATTISNYSLKNASGTVINITSSEPVAGSSNVYRLTTAQMNGGDYTFVISNIKDTSISANAMGTTTLTFACGDAIKPTVTATAKYSTDKTKLVVSFSEAMATAGEGSVLDLGSYALYDGGLAANTIKSWPTGTTIVPGTGNTSAIITFPAAFANLSTDDDVVVARVADAVGNKTAAISSVANLDPDALTVANIRDAGVKAINTTTVTFEVDSPLSAIDINNFTSVNGTAVSSVSYENKLVGANSDVNGAVVTVKTATAWATDNAAATVIMAANAMTTSLGTSNDGGITTAAAIDYIAPKIDTVTTGDADLDGKIDRIFVVYTENLNATSVDFEDYTVDGHTVSDVALAGATVTLTINETGYDTGSKPAVVQVGAVSDATAKKNVLAAGAVDSDGTLDGSAPVLVSAVITNAGATAGFGNDAGDVIQLTFSENIALKAGYAAADLENDFVLTADGTNFTADTFTVSGNTIIVTAAGAANVNPIVVGNTINIAGTYVAGDILAGVVNAAAANTAITVR